MSRSRTSRYMRLVGARWWGWLTSDGFGWLVGLAALDFLKAMVLWAWSPDLGRAEVPVYLAGLALFALLGIGVFFRISYRLWSVAQDRIEELEQSDAPDGDAVEPTSPAEAALERIISKVVVESPPYPILKRRDVMLDGLSEQLVSLDFDPATEQATHFQFSWHESAELDVTIDRDALELPPVRSHRLHGTALWITMNESLCLGFPRVVVEYLVVKKPAERP